MTSCFFTLERDRKKGRECRERDKKKRGEERHLESQSERVMKSGLVKGNACPKQARENMNDCTY